MAKKKQDGNTPPEGRVDRQVDFESALAEVEKVVAELESGELGLSESLAQYERGIEKIKLCHQVLQQAEKRIAVLTGVDADGTASVEPVDLGDGGQRSAAGRPGRAAGKQVGKRREEVDEVDDSGGLF